MVSLELYSGSLDFYLFFKSIRVLRNCHQREPPHLSRLSLSLSISRSVGALRSVLRARVVNQKQLRVGALGNVTVLPPWEGRLWSRIIMCAGLAVLGPPSLAGACYGTFWAGHASVMKAFDVAEVPAPRIPPTQPAWERRTPAGRFRVASWCHGEGGYLSAGGNHGPNGAALKISSWRGLGPSGPPMAPNRRCDDVVFVAGAAHTLVARYLEMEGVGES